MPAYAAMLVGLTLLVGFVFLHLTSLGNYSLVAPGLPEAAAGLWGFGLLLVVLDTQTEVSPARGAGIGLCLGALALTRAEPFLAGLVATALALPLLGARPLTQLVIFVVGEGIVGLVALIWGGDVALAGLRAHAVDGGAVVSFGLEAPAENFGRLLTATAYGVAVALCVLIMDRWTARWPRRALWIEAAAWVMLVPGLIVFVRWSQVGRPLPLVMVVALIVCLGLSWRRRGGLSGPASSRVAPGGGGGGGGDDHPHRAQRADSGRRIHLRRLGGAVDGRLGGRGAAQPRAGPLGRR
ncbi:MAG: hypothetical protein IPN01_19070 [Deltaproteobacteria bacterium]|nr:hypothetical protein [Deltaproteobacteria bacterium]